MIKERFTIKQHTKKQKNERDNRTNLKFPSGSSDSKRNFQILEERINEMIQSLLWNLFHCCAPRLATWLPMFNRRLDGRLLFIHHFPHWIDNILSQQLSPSLFLSGLVVTVFLQIICGEVKEENVSVVSNSCIYPMISIYKAIVIKSDKCVLNNPTIS